MSATSTLPAAGSQRPRFALVAARTAKPFRPAQAEQILPAGLLAAESSFEFRQCPRIVLHQLFHEPPHYLLWLPESSGYPFWKHSCTGAFSCAAHPVGVRALRRAVRLVASRDRDCAGWPAQYRAADDGRVRLWNANNR